MQTAPIIISQCTGRLFAVGDIHGCAAELDCLLAYLVEELSFSNDDILIFLGDYIDRGPNAFGVVDALIAFRAKFPKTIFLRGNHEQYLDKIFNGEPGIPEAWLRFGGSETLVSYGLPLTAITHLEESLPQTHLAFFRSLARYVITENFVFVHAGLDPLQSLLTQQDGTIYWIRDSFIQNPHSFGKTVVFGHTPQSEVLIELPYKIGIDTGCVYGHALTAVELTKGEIFQIEFGKTTISRQSFYPGPK